MTDPLNRVTQFQYDANGNVTQLTDAATQVWTATYEPTFSQVTSLTDPLRNLTTFEYDTSGNLTAITAPEENLKPAPDRLKTRLTYNSYGRVLTGTDPLNHTTTYTYTDAGDVATVTDPLGHTTTRTYDAVSRLVTQTDPLGRLTWYTYDLLNRLSTLAGNLQTVTDRKTQVTSYTYDALNRKTQASYADATSATFTHDAGSRLAQVTDTADPHRPIAFTYDPLDRLLAETTSLGTVTDTYDTAGRRTSMTVSGQTPVSYTYDHNTRLRTITQAPLTPVTIYYDAANRRTLLTLPNGVSAEYRYERLPGARCRSLGMRVDPRRACRIRVRLWDRRVECEGRRTRASADHQRWVYRQGAACPRCLRDYRARARSFQSRVRSTMRPRLSTYTGVPVRRPSALARRAARRTAASTARISGSRDCRSGRLIGCLLKQGAPAGAPPYRTRSSYRPGRDRWSGKGAIPRQSGGGPRRPARRGRPAPPEPPRGPGPTPRSAGGGRSA